MEILNSSAVRGKTSQAAAPEQSAARSVWPRRLWTLAGKMVPAILVVVALIGSASPAEAQSEPLTEYQIKAAFLYNFAKFVEWPGDAFSDSRAPIMLGIVGGDPFGKALDGVILGKTVNGRSLVVRRFRRGEDLRTCHILFVSFSERKRLPHILESLKGSSVLTVGETDGFVHSGGVVQFLLEESRVRFEINPDAAARVRLKISSKLLAVARIVPDGREERRN